MRVFLVICCLMLAGCSATRSPGSLFGPSESGTLVVDGTLIVDEPLPRIYVSETVGPGQTFTADTAAVHGAEVEVQQGNQVYTYRDSSTASNPGQYVPPDDAPLVLPDTEYQLTVRSGGRVARATTHTPVRFKLGEVVLLDAQTQAVRRQLKTFAEVGDGVYSAPENQVVYLDGLLEVRFTPIGVPAYQVGLFSLDPNSQRVINASFLSQQDYAKLKRENSSPPFEAPDGRLRLPWFAVYFAGRYKIRIYAVDPNWYDYIRSNRQGDGPGFGGLAGENFNRPIFDVQGGIGLFGSASVDSLGFFVQPPPQ